MIVTELLYLLNLSTENTCGLNWATLHVMTCRISWNFCNDSHASYVNPPDMAVKPRFYWT